MYAVCYYYFNRLNVYPAVKHCHINLIVLHCLDVEGRSLFVTNISFKVTEEDLKEHFDGCVAVRLPQHNGKSKGYVNKC